ncbi:MAG: hypothetical protein FJX36_06095 [Alphaproteobacteria bacterium]|nr:hypothetical protein [Alphaproteobacteria bacterium]
MISTCWTRPWSASVRPGRGRLGGDQGALGGDQGALGGTLNHGTQRLFPFLDGRDTPREVGGGLGRRGG